MDSEQEMARFFGARVLLFLWAAVLGTHTYLEKWPGVAIFFSTSFPLVLLPLEGFYKGPGFLSH